MIANAGFDLNSTVANVCDPGGWKWPNTWLIRFPDLNNVQPVMFHPNVQDRVVWRMRSGMDMDYQTACVWDDIRTHRNEVSWASLVWYPQAIPRHSFFMWAGPDSHDHPFFACPYATQIWHGVRGKVDMGSINSSWDEIYMYLLLFAESKKAAHVIMKLVVGASAYFV
ncbi:uncharacterized protein LOC118484054 [Helianthus annuus]|uniref:uncharacterized protein LOC118484054 n=1 Tax=Helianthus annuus TaxID=4232 RepID=UPI001652C6A4|nr:uncharacterized protein LOC118484054 [Helianthus annuus]